MTKVKGIMERVDSMTDQRTGCFTDEAMKTKEMMGVMGLYSVPARDHAD